MIPRLRFALWPGTYWFVRLDVDVPYALDVLVEP